MPSHDFMEAHPLKEVVIRSAASRTIIKERGEKAGECMIGYIVK
jgi:hypothetical protein